jgi:hypothetical protein
MKKLKDYLKDNVRTYKYRIKTVTNLTDKMIDRIDAALTKYDCVFFGTPTVTIIQNNPIDFTQFMNVEVTIIDVTTQLPLNPTIFEQELTNLLKLPKSYLIVRDISEPLDYENFVKKANEEIEKVKKDKNLKDTSLMDTTPEYDEETKTDTSEYYGNEYNKKLLNKLSYITTKRSNYTPTEQSEDFNKDIDTPKAVSPEKSKKVELYNDKVGKYGNFIDNKIKAVTRKFKDEDGNTVIVTKKYSDYNTNKIDVVKKPKGK